MNGRKNGTVHGTINRIYRAAVYTDGKNVPSSLEYKTKTCMAKNEIIIFIDIYPKVMGVSIRKRYAKLEAHKNY